MINELDSVVKDGIEARLRKYFGSKFLSCSFVQVSSGTLDVFIKTVNGHGIEPDDDYFELKEFCSSHGFMTQFYVGTKFEKVGFA